MLKILSRLEKNLIPLLLKPEFLHQKALSTRCQLVKGVEPRLAGNASRDNFVTLKQKQAHTGDGTVLEVQYFS